MSRNFIIIFSLLSLTIQSCLSDAKSNQNTQNNNNPNATTAANYTALAAEYCACSTPLVALNKRAKYLATHPDEIKNPDEMSDLLVQSEQLQEKQLECQKGLETRFSTQIQENPAALEAIKKTCPDLAEFIENSKKNDDQ